MRYATHARRVLFASIFVLALMAWAAPAADAGIGDYDVSDPSQVYYGNIKLFQRPASVDCDRVYNHIPEYQEILRRGLTDKSPAYHLLMKKASARFAAAVKKMAASHRHDLVAHLGAVSKAKAHAKDIPDRTDKVIQAID